MRTRGPSAGDPPGLGELMSLQQLRHDTVWRAAIAARSPLASAEACDALTAGRGDRHRSTSVGFNVVRRPAGAAWFGNQEFEPVR